MYGISIIIIKLDATLLFLRTQIENHKVHRSINLFNPYVIQSNIARHQLNIQSFDCIKVRSITDPSLSC